MILFTQVSSALLKNGVEQKRLTVLYSVSNLQEAIKKGNCYHSRSDLIINMPSFTRFSEDVEWMTGRKLNLFWQITWRFISPLLLLIVFMAFVTLQMQKPPSYTAWNPKYVCAQIFLEFLIKGRTIYFSPLPDPLISLLSTAYPLKIA